jgi:hypothetical protein
VPSPGFPRHCWPVQVVYLPSMPLMVTDRAGVPVWHSTLVRPTWQLMLPDGETNSPPVAVCMCTNLKLVAGVRADDVDCPAEAPGAVDEEPTDEVAPASGDAVGDCAADAGDVAWAEADELESCVLHPTMRTPATARAAPVSNVRRAAILVIFFLNPLSTSTVHVKHGGEITKTPPGP